MSNELSIQAALRMVRDGTTVDPPPLSKLIDVSGSNVIHHRQTIGTSAEAIDLGDAAAGGYCLAANRDATNFIQLYAATGETAFVRLKAGEFALFRLDSGATAPFAKADTAACDLEFWLVED